MSPAISNKQNNLDRTQNILNKYIPSEASGGVVELLQQYPCKLKIVRSRRTKHGDFRSFGNGEVQITVNNDLNPYRFLLTLVHEIAHLVTYRESNRVKPHGEEWKRNFKLLMLPFLRPEIFPEELLPELARYLKRPKASTDSDSGLSLALRAFDPLSHRVPVREIPEKGKFLYNNRTFVKGSKRRTRYECLELMTHKKYVFHPHAEVEPIHENKQ